MPDDRSAALPSAGEALIERYASIARTSRAMLAAARAGDWDAVAGLEDDCRALIGALRREAEERPLPAQAQRRRITLLREMLADDAEIRVRAEPWLQQLEGLVRAAPQSPRG